MLTNEQLESAVASTPGEKVTKDYIESRIVDVMFTRLTDTLTICVIELDNGFTSLGQSACVDPENYRKEIAYDNAFDKLWPLFGFLLAEKRYLQDIEDYGAGN